MNRPLWARPETPLFCLQARGCVYEVNSDGSLGTLWLFRIVRGQQHVQPWRKSNGGNTPLVRANRRRFAAAMAAWKELSSEERERWEWRAKKRYNYKCMPYSAFVADFIKTHPLWEFL